MSIENLNIGFTDSDLYDYSKNQNIPQFPHRINKSLQSIVPRPHAIFIFDNKPLILFFKNIKEEDREKLFNKCWNFSETPIILIEDGNDFNIYNGFEFFIKNKSFLLNILPKKDFNYTTIITGEYFKNLPIKKADQQVDTILLKNIKDTRVKLINEGLPKKIANSLITRVIFIRYLIDREVKFKLEANGQKRLYAKRDLINILASKEKTYQLFKYLKSKEGFNGDWFKIEEDEESIVNEERHLNILADFLNGVNQNNKQGVLLDIYDFSVIPIEFISNVYERFIGEAEKKDGGSYYTPTFLVDYILDQTVNKYFEENPKEINCKVLDPACGSGIFLVETLRKLIAQHEKINNEPIKPTDIVKLVENNIFGIDKDEDAIRISIFSLYLTMLDYQNPKDIEKFTFPNLLFNPEKPNKKANFFNNDFFDIQAKFNKILETEKINFIIGNPPYKRGATNTKIINDYIKHNNLIISDRNIVQPFMLRVKDFASKNTVISFIVTSKILYNIGEKAKQFRKNFLQDYSVKHVLELSLVSMNKKIFKSASVPISILFYKKKDDEDNIINYTSVKPHPLFDSLNMLYISKYDNKKILQSHLLNNDVFWKTIVHGSHIDLKLVRKLFANHPTIKKIIKEKGINIGQGVQYSTTEKSDKNPAHIYHGKKEMQLYNFEHFFISDIQESFTEKFLHRVREPILFVPNVLLIKEGVNSETLKSEVALLYTDAIYSSTFTGLQSDNKANLNTLKNIAGILSSRLSVYLLLSSSGIERGQLHDDDRLSIPYIESSKISDSVSEIEKKQKKIYSGIEVLKPNIDDNYSKALLAPLDKVIEEAFNINEEETIILNYAEDIIIPRIKKKKNYLKVFQKLDYKSEVLSIYINQFIKRFSSIYSKNSMYFSANVMYDSYAIGIYFKISYDKPQETISWEKNSNLRNFLGIGSIQKLENLFMQQDIKFFESDGFCIVKPNEYKNWHEYIALLDCYEFEDALIRARK